MRAVLAVLFALSAGAAQAADATLAQANYPEGALWHDGRLFYEEMADDIVRVSDLKTRRTFWRKQGCGPVNIAPYRDDEYLVLCHLAHAVVRVSRKGQTIAVIERDANGAPFVYPNGAGADGEGGVYFSSAGTFALNAPATGAVLYLARDGTLTRVAEGIRYANGVAVDAKRKRVLVSAHLARQVLSLPIVKPGVLGERSVFFDLAANGIDVPYPLAGPDGLEVDEGGHVVVAEYGAGRLHRIAPDGTWLGSFGGVGRFVTDVALLPKGRAAITAPDVNDRAPYPGSVLLRDRFSERFVRVQAPP